MFIEEFKKLARKKCLAASDMLALCIYKAMREDAEDIEYYIKKAFTPGRICQHRPTEYYAVKVATNCLRNNLQRKWDYTNIVEGKPTRISGLLLGKDALSIFTQEELNRFLEILGHLA